MAEQFPPVKINLTPVKVAGLAGVPLLVVVGTIAVVFPIARWLLLLGGLGGLLVSVAMILVRRRHGTDPSDDSPIGLGVASAPRRRNGSASRTPENTVRLADLRV